jgi:hypothetical protein
MNVSHLMFAIFFFFFFSFGKAVENQNNCITATLKKFSALSSQVVSIKKTGILFSKAVV